MTSDVSWVLLAKYTNFILSILIKSGTAQIMVDALIHRIIGIFGS